MFSQRKEYSRSKPLRASLIENETAQSVQAAVVCQDVGHVSKWDCRNVLEQTTEFRTVLEIEESVHEFVAQPLDQTFVSENPYFD